jgi:hypothetical protein
MRTKRDFMELLHNSPNILKKGNNLNQDQIIKTFGSKFLINIDLILMELVRILRRL